MSRFKIELFIGNPTETYPQYKFNTKLSAKILFIQQMVPAWQEIVSACDIDQFKMYHF